MNFQEEYKAKLRTAEEAVKIVKSGDWLDYGFCTGTVNALDEALAARYAELSDVKVRGGILIRRPKIADVPEASSHFCWNSWHCSGIERKLIKEGFAYYIPMRYSEVPSYYRNCIDDIDVAMFQVAPMDEHGFFNFGPVASFTAATCERAKKIIVEVNEHMPRCLGGYEEGIHVSQVDMIVEGKNPPMDQMGSAGEPSEIDLAVARLVLEELCDGACLQLGIGSMPNAVGKLIAQSDLKDLGVHTEMYVDAFVDLALAGKVTGRYKPFDRGRQVYAFAGGSQKLYDYIDNNPALMSAPVDYVNDIRRVSQIPHFMSINGAVDIDLYGQISAESSGTQQISGAGGQMDFVMGAYLSQGGKSFICCSSSFVNKKTGEKVSRIRPTFLPGTNSTCTRSHTHFVVTEQGKVNLKGKSTWERAEALISIADPDFREGLIAEAQKMGIWRQSNKR